MEVKKFVSTDVRVSACKKNYHCTKAGHSIYYEGKIPMASETMGILFFPDHIGFRLFYSNIYLL